MAPTTVQQVLLSPAELSYLHTSLSLTPPIRPDSRLPQQFRPLSAETDILPGTNGSARITFADGTEAIVGIKAEVEKSSQKYCGYTSRTEDTGHVRDDEEGRYGDNKWLEMSIEVPGFRDDDAMPVLLTSVLTEALLADSSFTRRLWINRRFHWKLYIDVSSHIIPIAGAYSNSYIRSYFSPHHSHTHSHSCPSPHISLFYPHVYHVSSPKRMKIHYSTMTGMHPFLSIRAPPYLHLSHHRQSHRSLLLDHP